MKASMTNTTSTSASLRAALASSSSSSSSFVSVSPNCTSTWMLRFKNTIPSVSLSNPNRNRRRSMVSCEVAVEVSSSSSQGDVEDAVSKVGKRVRVKVPLKVYHVPKVPEVDLSGMEGEIKQYVGIWNGKQISANLPFKVQFFTEIEGRGSVKFFAHLREEEFEYV